MRTWIGEHGWEAALLAAAAGVVGAHVFGRVVADPDLWGHVMFGQLVLTDGLPRLDPFAYTSGDHPWINHEILSEVALGWAFARFGGAGLHALRYVLVGSVTLIVWRELARGGLGTAGGALGTALVVSAMGAGIATARPHLFTYLFFLLVLVCLVRADGSETRWTWFVPPVIAVWVNTHGGVLAGVGVVGLWWAGEGLAALRGGRDDPVPAPTATLVLIACLLALLVNPYGWELPLFLLDTATEARPMITEWQPVTRSMAALSLWGTLTVSGLVLLSVRRPRIRLSHGLVLAVLAVLPLLAVRHLPLYALGWAVLLGPHMPDLVGWLRTRRRARLRAGTFSVAREAVLVGVGVSVAAAGAVVAVDRGSFPCVPLPSAEHDVRPPPRAAVNVLERSGVSADLATPFGWGEYVIWHLAPRVRVGMDGRRETVYPDSVYRDYRSFRAGAGDWYRWLDRYGADMALVMTESPPDNLLALKPGWREVHRDDVAALYGREEFPGTARVAAVAGGGDAGSDGPERSDAGCFPG